MLITIQQVIRIVILMTLSQGILITKVTTMMRITTFSLKINHHNNNLKMNGDRNLNLIMSITHINNDLSINTTNKTLKIETLFKIITHNVIKIVKTNIQTIILNNITNSTIITNFRIKTFGKTLITLSSVFIRTLNSHIKAIKILS